MKILSEIQATNIKGVKGYNYKGARALFRGDKLAFICVGNYMTIYTLNSKEYTEKVNFTVRYLS